MTHYADRDHAELDRDGNYYIRHVAAMTKEGLHAKSDIAAELAWRDREIDRLRRATAAPVVEGEEDTARLDWLIENRPMLTTCGGQWFSAYGITCFQSDTARGAIDAAMAAALAGD